MWAGTVVSVHLAREEGAPTYAVSEARAVAGAGLEGDRNFQPDGGLKTGVDIAQEQDL